MPLPPETSLDAVLVKIKETYSNPSIGNIRQVVLRDGPRAFRVATLLEVLDSKTRDFHHYSLKIDHINKRAEGWFADPERSVRLDGDEPDEVDTLYRFLHALYEGKLDGEPGTLHIIRGEDYARLEQLLEALPNLADTDKLQIVKTILSQLEESSSDVSGFAAAFQRAKPGTLKHIAAASRMVDYKLAFQQLKALVDDPATPERDLQEHLKKHPWMFGSEYSELLSRRTWTRDDKLDYMLRRTVDGYLEIVEIKTPFAEALFIHDTSHDSYYPSAKLSPVLGQVIRYIEEVERNRDSIIAHDECDTLKIRSRIILGRDGPPEHQAALRNLNSHLHRIEVLTFDQLLRIATRVIAVFEAEEDQDEQAAGATGDSVVF
ncbi:MAG: DUF4263 domain-containing protein [Candidatus Hydrogenedentes bacterium]|nr:DUF4263 domain-containing protein [Candidatus Hydrogenedentota bacterium]